MGLLERYKKSGGFVQLLCLLETCTPQKREKFLSMIKEENPTWETALRPRILSVDRIFTWSPVVLTEILTRMQVINIAVMMSGFDENRQGQMSGILNFSQHKQVKTLLENKKFTLAEVNISIEKFLTEARSLISQGIIKLEKIDPELEVPFDIEDKLNTASMIKLMNSQNPSSRGEDKCYDGEDFRMPMAPPSLELLLQPQETDNHKDLLIELTKLKEKVQILTQENFMLKHENDVLQDKLERIRKIA
jgi:hypothetical protein